MLKSFSVPAGSSQTFSNVTVTGTGTFGNVVISGTGTITPSQTGGIVGTTTNNAVQAGSVGEFVETVVTAGSPVTITISGVSQNLAVVALTAGDWDVGGIVTVNPGTSVTVMSAGTNTSATLPAIERQTQLVGVYAGRISAPIPIRQYSLAANASVALIANVTFTGVTNMYGYVNARRVR